MNVLPVDAIGIGAQRGHDHDLLVIARRHEDEVPCPGQQFEVRRGRQFTRQCRGVLVDSHQLVAIAAVEQHRHMHIGQGVAAELQAQRRHQHQGVDARISHRLQVVAVDNQFALGVARIAVVRALLAVSAQTIQVRVAPDRINAVSPPAE